MTVASSTRHFLGLREVSRDRLIGLLESAASMLPIVRGEAAPLDMLSGRTIANIFLENSTRTRVSFTMAAQRLGAQSIDLLAASSSQSKGESLLDTARNVEAMGVDAMVLRCSASGGAHMLAQHVQCPVINGGDGTCEHPTQGLLDMLAWTNSLATLDLSGRTLGIVGDVLHSRVARSAAYAASCLGSDVVFIGPPAMVPESVQGLLEGLEGAGRGSLRIAHDLDATLPQLDAAMMLRVQFERGAELTGDYAGMFGMNSERAQSLPSHAVILHPGPINRGIELDDATADGDRSLILDQVTCGVAARMAVLAEQLGRHI